MYEELFNDCEKRSNNQRIIAVSTCQYRSECRRESTTVIRGVSEFEIRPVFRFERDGCSPTASENSMLVFTRQTGGRMFEGVIAPSKLGMYYAYEREQAGEYVC